MNILREMLDNLTSKPCTILYPKEKAPIPKGFRGRVVIVTERCIGCAKCSKVCPPFCIEMVPDQQPIEFKGKQLVRRKRPQIKLYRCIRCGLCEQYCPTDAIHLTNELSSSGRDCEDVVM